MAAASTKLFAGDLISQQIADRNKIDGESNAVQFALPA